MKIKESFLWTITVKLNDLQGPIPFSSRIFNGLEKIKFKDCQGQEATLVICVHVKSPWSDQYRRPATDVANTAPQLPSWWDRTQASESKSRRTQRRCSRPSGTSPSALRRGSTVSSFVMWRKSPTQPHNISLNRVDTPTCQSKPVPLNSFSHGQLEETLGCARVTRLKTIQEERKSKNLFHHKHSNFHRSEYTRLTSMFGIKHC